MVEGCAKESDFKTYSLSSSPEKVQSYSTSAVNTLHRLPVLYLVDFFRFERGSALQAGPFTDAEFRCSHRRLLGHSSSLSTIYVAIPTEQRRSQSSPSCHKNSPGDVRLNGIATVLARENWFLAGSDFHRDAVPTHQRRIAESLPQSFCSHGRNRFSADRALVQSE